MDIQISLPGFFPIVQHTSGGGMGSHQTSGAGGGGGGTSRRGPEAMAKRYPRGGSFEWGGTIRIYSVL